MNGTEQIQAQYLRLCDGMVRKDTAMLERILDDSFIMDHLTGQSQTREAFLAALLDGTLNYFAVRHEALPVTVRGDRAELIGRAQVTAETFGGRRETLPVERTLNLEKREGTWRIIRSAESLY